MAEETKISWCHSTFNPWLGCTKISPGCDNCYADELDRRRFSKTLGGGTKVVPIRHWGPGAPRHRTSPSNWKAPLAWNRKAAGSGQPWRVFCASLADVFDNDVPDAWRSDLWDLIEETPNLTWLLLTKRIGNAPRMLRTVDWASSTRWNVWIGASIVNQEEAERDLPKLAAVPARVRFVSYEPALGRVDFRPWLDRLQWLIVGGESGGNSRPFNMEWAQQTVMHGMEAGVPVMVKQMGARSHWGAEHYAWKDKAGADPMEWPEAFRVQEFPKQ